VSSPEIYPENARRLHDIAKRIDMPTGKLVNLILAVAVVDLEDMGDFDDLVVYVPAKPEEPRGSEKG